MEEYSADCNRLYDTVTPIVVGGNHWSSAERWQKLSNELRELRDPKDNLIFEAHCYFDIDASGIYRKGYDEEHAYPTVGVDRVRPFVEWEVLTGLLVHDGTSISLTCILHTTIRSTVHS